MTWPPADAGILSPPAHGRQTARRATPPWAASLDFCRYRPIPKGASIEIWRLILARPRFVMHLSDMNPGLVIIIAGVILLVIGLAAQIDQ